MKKIIKDVLEKIYSKEIEVHLRDFDGCHRDVSCDGVFALVIKQDVLYHGFTFGPIIFNKLPMVKCKKCEAGFIPDEFLDYVEYSVALNLLIADGLWTKDQLKFLREFFEKTQEEIASLLGIAGKHEMSKRESTRFPNCVLDRIKQFYLRNYYIDLAIKKFHPSKDISEEIFKIIRQLPSKGLNLDKEIKIDQSFIPSWNDISVRITPV